MIHHITESDLFRIAMEIITTTDDDRFTKFADTLYELCNEDINDITVFRVLNYTRVRLCALRDNPAVADEAQRVIVRRSLTTIIGYLDTELDIFVHHRTTFESSNLHTMCWTGSFIELIELAYGLQEMQCIDNGEMAINELLAGFGKLFGIEIKDNLCYNAYADMKRRKNDSRTYFLDKMREKLNRRMQHDDEKEMMRK